MNLHPHLPLVTLAVTTIFSATACARDTSAPDVNWSEYLGGPDRSHYSTLTEITADNVSQLQPAWEYHTGEPGEMQCNPLVVDGVLYGVTATGGVFALDAATGRELWKYTEIGEGSGAGWQKNYRTQRGLTYWSVKNERRLYFTSGEWLWALDATTGSPIPGFGEGGRTSLKAGLGDDATNKWVVSTTPGTLFENLIVMPLRTTENGDAAPGFIQAFDIHTGKVAWVFHTIPPPGAPGSETWANPHTPGARIGGANCWAGMAVDRTRGLVYVPTGSIAPDFWGGERQGDNLYANSLLALDARTGRLRWHQQLVHHDLWDRDLPAPPNLLTIRRDGQATDAVAQITKVGYVYVFNRETGEPLFPIHETPVPPSPVPGEHASPTQPIPALPAPFARQHLTEDDIGTLAVNREELLQIFRNARSGLFQPFDSKKDTILLPGFDGGAEWGGAATDPHGVLYVNANEMPWVARLLESTANDIPSDFTPGHRVYATYCTACHGAERTGNPTAGFPSLVDLGSKTNRDAVQKLIISGKGMMPGFPMIGTTERQQLLDFLFGSEKTEGPAATAASSGAAPAVDRFKLDGYVKFLDRDGYPAISPPWGTLTAIDLNTGEHKWRIPFGEFPELTAKGIPLTGRENYGGPVVTASGLLFIAASKDARLRVYDCETGKLLWQTQLPAAGFATPSIYSVGGRQFIAIAAGGTKQGNPKGDSYIAFALPSKKQAQ